MWENFQASFFGYLLEKLYIKMDSTPMTSYSTMHSRKLKSHQRHSTSMWIIIILRYVFFFMLPIFIPHSSKMSHTIGDSLKVYNNRVKFSYEGGFGGSKASRGREWHPHCRLASVVIPGTRGGVAPLPPHSRLAHPTTVWNIEKLGIPKSPCV